MLLGCIGDDFTGSSDLANTLTREGMRTVQYTGVPAGSADPSVQAGVIALKSRTAPVGQAVEQSLAALAWLREQGCRQFLFKVCSTFDSTPEGNIGPVAEALAEALGAERVVVCPAFPGTGRSVYQGHLFVDDALLNESGMQDHPLTPMKDADLRRWLARQTRGSVGHVAAIDVLAGSAAIGAALQREQDAGHRLIIVDALRDEDLRAIGAACADVRLLTGGSGIALGLPANLLGDAPATNVARRWHGESGRCVVLCGSCSNATRGQLEAHRRDHPAFAIDPVRVLNGEQTPGELVSRLLGADGIPVAYSSGDPDEVRRIQREHGREATAAALDGFFAETARRLVEGGVRRLITAGGETSGAVVEGLALHTLEIGPEIAPGVPALRGGPELVLALKSGNFGGEDFFATAAARLDRHA